MAVQIFSEMGDEGMSFYHKREPIVLRQQPMRQISFFQRFLQRVRYLFVLVRGAGGWLDFEGARSA
jgi:hypothetical protein